MRQMPFKPEGSVFLTIPPQSNGLFQTGVQTVHDQPKEVVFQTTTMEKLVEAEKVGVMHASGKTGIIPAPDTDFRSPVMDDVPVTAPEPAETPAGVEGLGRLRLHGASEDWKLSKAYSFRPAVHELSTL
jgi:hypothetical protein